MPAHADPAAARRNDDLVIDIQRQNRAPADGGQAEQTDAGRIPCKVIRPLMLTGMIQRREVPGERVGGPSGCPFEFITSTTGKAEVVKLSRAALGFRDQVVDDHGLAGIGLCGLTVGTSVVVGIDQLLAQRFRKIGTHGEAIAYRPGECDVHASGAGLPHELYGASNDRLGCVTG